MASTFGGRGDTENDDLLGQIIRSESTHTTPNPLSFPILGIGLAIKIGEGRWHAIARLYFNIWHVIYTAFLPRPLC